MAKITNPRYNGKGKRKIAKHFSAGGMLVGPSHDAGGIGALVDGTEPIEVEGGDFIINKQTVDAVGEDFLHKLNSTQTSHHTGGFGEGQLPQPSQYKDGGKVTRRNNMARGRRAPQRRRGIAPARRMARGGRATVARKTAPRRATGTPRRKMANGGSMGNRSCGGPGQMPCGGRMSGYRKGGKPVAKYPHGGSHCGPGMTMAANGGCVPMSGGGYRKGGRTKPVIKRKVKFW